MFVLFVGMSSAWAGLELSVGGAAGGAFYEPELATGERGFAAAGSPVLSLQVDPWDGAVRPVIGLTSAPTFLYSAGYDAYTAPLIVVDAGLLFGGPNAHGALTAHGGLLSVGASARFTATPLTLGPRARTGFELRATWLARWGGYGALLWTTRLGG
jgi:hypothetical protein